jgi:hypothetical protein
MLATAMTVSKRLLRTGVIARLSRINLLIKFFTFLASQKQPQCNIAENHHD